MTTHELQQQEYSRERIELIKKTVCPSGIDDMSFELFLEQCRRSGLDPLKKQMFCVKRNQKVGRDQWVTKFEAQPAEAGMLARAERFPDFCGITAEAVYEKDDCNISPGSGEVHHVFCPGDRGKLLGAWARVRRTNRDPVVRFLRLSDYAQDNPMWSSKGETMIVKCARVAVLRVSFPEAFGGLYINEEMPPSAPASSLVEVIEESRPAKLIEKKEPSYSDFTEDEKIAYWRKEIASAKHIQILNTVGKSLKQQEPSADSAIRTAVRAEYSAKFDELAKGGANG